MTTPFSLRDNGARPFLQQGKVSRLFISNQKGSVIFYVFLAIGLLAALTYAMTKDSRSNLTTEMGLKASEELFAQTNAIRSVIAECTIEYPGGGPDTDADGFISPSENPNNPYPINPTSASNPEGAQTSDQVRKLSCTGAPVGKRNMFQGVQNKGRYLPPPPASFGEWTYINDTAGVRIQIIGTPGAGTANALSRLMSRFGTCEADLNYGSCGAACFTAWVQRTACP